MKKILFAIAAIMLAAVESGSIADAAEIKVISSYGMHAIMVDLGPQFEKATGNKLNIAYDTSSVRLKKQIDTGEAFDIAILTTDVIDDLIKEGKIIADTRSDIVRVPIGIGIRSGLPKPDIGSVDGFKRALLDAKSFAYTQGSVSGNYMLQLFDRLGIADVMKSKITVPPVGTTAVELVSKGEVQMNVDLIPEMLLWPNVEIVGPLPAALQNDLRFAAGVGSRARERGASKALIEFLTAPAAIRVIKAKGMQPG